MTLTRELLMELQLNEPTIQRILSVHQKAIDALTESADSHQQEAERLRSEYDAYRQEVAAERTAAQRQSVIRAALKSAGANEQAIPLLAMAVTTTEEDWEDAQLRDAAGVLAPIQEQYAGFFAQPVPLPTDPIAPPLDGSALTLEDVRRMSAGDINRNWSAVCSALNTYHKEV